MFNSTVKIARLMAVGMLVMGMGSMSSNAGTHATFSDSGASTANTFTAGTVDLTLNGANNVSNTVSFSGNMVPGDAVTAPAGGLVVANNNATGKAVPLRYALTSIVEAGGSATLAKRLDL